MRLGPYSITRRIGSGGMAQVLAATRFGASGFTTQVAIKTLLPERADDPELQRSLIAEAKLGASLHHRNLVAVHDLGVDQGRYYMVMEHVDGADLRRVLEGGALTTALACHVAGEVAAALAYLHAACDEVGRPLGLVHRDVTPSNVLVSRTGEVKLADYGIAKATALASQTDARIVRGKFAYLSPEQVGAGKVTARSDQFALGIVLVEMLTGRRPFDAPDVAATLERLRGAEAPDLEGVPDALAPVIRRCLAPDPGARFEDMTALRAALPGGADVDASMALAQRVAALQ